jgi:3-oxoacyl-[acyl-carrier protein] reductase
MKQGKVALVTGASQGIGRAVAARLGADGHSVVVNYRADAAAAAESVAAVEAAGGRAVAVQADVTEPKEVVRLFDAAQEHFGGVDVLVNNVGGIRFAPLAQAPDEDFDWHFDLNTRSTFTALREAARRIGDGGRIVVISSGMTLTHRATAGLYIASKAAIEALAGVLAQELGPRGITVNSVRAGLTVQTGAERDLTDEIAAQVIARTPLRRLGLPDDIADVVGFLVSEQGRWVTGQSISAGGGGF